MTAGPSASTQPDVRPGAVVHAVAQALHRAFVGADGLPVPVQTRELTREQAAVLHPANSHRVAVTVPDLSAVAAVLPGIAVTSAIAVIDPVDAVLLYVTEPVATDPGVLAEVTHTAVRAATDQLTEDVGRMRAEAGVLDALHSIGRRLTAQLDINVIVQDATDAATKATGAAFGAFFYNLINEFGESYTLYTLSGVPRESFAKFPMPRNTAVFAPTFDGLGTVRSPDITKDPRFGRNEPYYGMPHGHLPVRSYLAVSVISPTTGEVLGGFFFGHPEPGRFTQRHEYLAEGIAGYTAIALDNARLFEQERNLATRLSKLMQPTVPQIPGLSIVTRYLPAATGTNIGGDWFDVIQLASGGTAFVIGDVVGHGVLAAAIMGQIRTAIRSYALLELEPSELLRNVSQLTGGLPESNFVTCFYAVHDPADDSLTYANAGHLPAILLHPDGTIEQVGEALAQPLGVGAQFPQQQGSFPAGTRLLLYTDGLVERRPRDLTVGINRLLGALAEVRTMSDIEAACDRLIERMAVSGHDDDIALIHVHHHGGSMIGHASAGHLATPPRELHLQVEATPEQLIELRAALTDWASTLDIDNSKQQDIVLASYEAMANSAEHAYRDNANPDLLDVRASFADARVTVTVTDYGTWKPPDTSDSIRGRGLILIKALTQNSELTHREDGTTVTMIWTAQPAGQDSAAAAFA